MKKAVAVILSLMIMTLTASCGAKNETPTNVETKTTTTTTTTTTTLSVKAKLEQELNTIKSGKGANEEKIKLLNALKDKISKENKDVDFSSIIKEIDKYVAEITPTTTVKATEKQVENQEKEVYSNNDSSDNEDRNNSSDDSSDNDNGNGSDNGSSDNGGSSNSDRRYQYGDRGYPYGYAEGAEDENGKYYTDERGDAWLQRPGESDWMYVGNQADLYGIV